MSEKAFGERVRALRAAAGGHITQLQVAAACLCDNSKISRLEAGRQRPTPNDARLLDDFFGTTPELADLAAKLFGPEPRRQSRTFPRNELPPAPAYLLGRDEPLAEVLRYLRFDEDAGRTVRLCLIHGLPGFGKTALATFAADKLREQYPDGLLYLDLNGYSADQPAVAAAGALDTLLRRLRVPGAEIPTTGEADLAAELRTRIGASRFLVLIENVLTSASVDVLASALPGCAVIVTSRSRLTSRYDSCRIELSALREDDAGQLFSRSYGGESAPDQVRALVRLSYGNPFLIRVLAGRLRDNPTLSLDHLVQRLDDAPARVQTMTALLRTSHALLSTRQKDTLSALALHPGLRIDSYSAAALTGVTPGTAAELLDELFRACMVEAHAFDAYRLHDLVKDFLQHGEPSAGSPREAPHRLFAYYLRQAAAAYQVSEPHRYRIDLGLPAGAEAVRDFRSAAEAGEWLRNEQANLLPVCREMAAHGFLEICWKFCFHLRTYFFESKQWPSWHEVYTVGADAAQRLGDQRAEGIMLNSAGVALAAAGDAERAVDCHVRAAAAAAAARDEYGVAAAQAHRGWALHLLGDNETADELTRSALAFYRREDSGWNVATTLESLAYIALRRGRTTTANECFAEAHALFTGALNLTDYARTMADQFKKAKDFPE